MRSLYMVFLIILSFSIVSCSGNNNEATAKENNTESAKLQWNSFNEGLLKAEKEGKHILVDFYTDWCHWCKVMDKKTFQEKNVSKKLSERFVTIKLNAEDRNATVTYKGKTYSNAELTQAFGVRGFPTLIFLDEKGEGLFPVSGYVPAETFVHYLNYVDQGCYKNNIRIDDFISGKAKCDKKEKI